MIFEMIDGKNDLLRQAQLVQLDVLLELDRFCKKHDIKYQLYAGTLLGAIRHQGFIPWDDDIDIAIKRDDYNKFVASYQSNDRYFLQTYETDPNYVRQFARLRRNNTVYRQKVHSHLDVHHGIFIDVFPLDKVYNTHEKESKRLDKNTFLLKMNRIRNMDIKNRDLKLNKRILYNILKTSNLFVSKNTFDKYKTKNLTLRNRDDLSHYNHLTNGTTKKRFYKYLMNESTYDDMILHEFEGHKFPIPRDYDLVLSQLYGDYMKLPPIEEQKPHHGIVELKINKGDFDEEI